MAYRLVLDESYPEAQSYRGPAEQGIAEFKGPLEQLAPVNIVAQIARTLIQATRASAGVPLHIRIWADTSPFLWTNYKIEYALHASPFPWLIFIGVLVGLGLIALTAWQVSDIDWGEMGEAVAEPVKWGSLAVIALVVLAVMGMSGRKEAGSGEG